MTTNEATNRQLLLTRIEQRRATVVDYARRLRPRSNRLTMVSIVSSALAAVLTAGPALGGPGFTELAGSRLGLRDDSLVWQILCALALLVSVASTISAALLKRQDVAARLAAAEAVAVELENLRTSVDFDQIEVGEALASYQQALAKVPFVDDVVPDAPPPPRSTGAFPAPAPPSPASSRRPPWDPGRPPRGRPGPPPPRRPPGQ